jgi:hypothetical protein
VTKRRTLDSEKHHPVNGYANDHQAEAVNGTDHAAKQAEEQDLFRGFAFEPFPVRRRPLSASTRYSEKIASCGKGKAREETVASVEHGRTQSPTKTPALAKPFKLSHTTASSSGQLAPSSLLY